MPSRIDETMLNCEIMLDGPKELQPGEILVTFTTTKQVIDLVDDIVRYFCLRSRDSVWIERCQGEVMVSHDGLIPAETFPVHTYLISVPFVRNKLALCAFVEGWICSSHGVVSYRCDRGCVIPRQPEAFAPATPGGSEEKAT